MLVGIAIAELPIIVLFMLLELTLLELNKLSIPVLIDSPKSTIEFHNEVKLFLIICVSLSTYAVVATAVTANKAIIA